MNDEAERRELLGKFVKRERRLKFKTVDKARAVAQISRGAWDNVEAGRKVKDFTLSAIEQALGHEAGLYERILAEAVINPSATGGDPSPVGPPKQDASYVASPGERVEAGESDDAVLRAINAMRADVDKLAGVPEALADLARRMETVERRTESLDGPESTT